MRTNKWTLKEEELLLSKLKEGCGVAAISGELGRTEGAIKARISKLKKEGKIVKEEKKVKGWTTEEENILEKK